MSIKNQAKEFLAKSEPKFEGISLNFQVQANSRLVAQVTATGSIDLPGDLDVVIADFLQGFVRGKSVFGSSPSSPEQPATSPDSSQA